jgi:hypothetical protein
MKPIRTTPRSKNKKKRTVSKSGKNRTVSKNSQRDQKKTDRSYSRIIQWLGIGILSFFVLYTAFNFTNLVRLSQELDVEDVLEHPSRLNLLELDGIKKSIYIFEEFDDQGQKVVTDVYLTVYDDQSSDLLVIYIPGWVYITPVNRDVSSEYTIRNLEYVGSLLEEESSYEYTIWELENVTGISVDSYVWFEPEATQTWKEELVGEDIDSFQGEVRFQRMLNGISLFNLLFRNESLPKITDSTKSNMSVFEIYSQIKAYSGLINKGGIGFVDMGLEEALEVEAVVGGDDRYHYSEGYSDSEVNKYIDAVRGREVEREQSKCEVYNGSSIPKLATQFTRRIENNGLRVIRADNSPVAYEKTTIYVSDLDRFKHTLDQVKNVLPMEPDVIEGRPKFLTTGDVVLILGEDFESAYTFK